MQWGRNGRPQGPHHPTAAPLAPTIPPTNTRFARTPRGERRMVGASGAGRGGKDPCGRQFPQHIGPYRSFCFAVRL